MSSPCGTAALHDFCWDFLFSRQMICKQHIVLNHVFFRYKSNLKPVTLICIITLQNHFYALCNALGNDLENYLGNASGNVLGNSWGQGGGSYFLRHFPSCCLRHFPSHFENHSLISKPFPEALPKALPKPFPKPIPKPFLKQFFKISTSFGLVQVKNSFLKSILNRFSNMATKSELRTSSTRKNGFFKVLMTIKGLKITKIANVSNFWLF